MNPNPNPDIKPPSASTVACDELLADGWREYTDQFKSYSRCFYKQFDTPTRCSGNDDKPGIQVTITVTKPNEHFSIEMELCAGLKDGTWIKILNYSLPKTVKEVTALIPRMLSVWESANFQPEITIKELSENASYIGFVSGVLQGIELTTTLLPNQKEAISKAREALHRLEERNQKLINP